MKYDLSVKAPPGGSQLRGNRRDLEYEQRERSGIGGFLSSFAD